MEEREKEQFTSKDYLRQIDIALAGRLAEEVFLGKEKVSSFGEGELRDATNLGYQYVRKF